MCFAVLPQRIYYERTLYYHTAHTKQRLHDAGLVWAFKVTRVWHQQQLAAHWRHRLLVGHRLLRVLLSGTCQPFGIRRKRRTLQPHSAEGHPGVYLAGRVLHHCQHHVPGHPPALESHLGILTHHLRRLSGVYEMTEQRGQSQACLDFAESRWNSMKSNDVRRTTLETI